MNRRREFMLVADNQAIDFANTVCDAAGDPGGAIRSWADLMEFLKATGQITALKAASYRNRTASTLALALKLRDDLCAILAALASGGKIPADHVEAVNAVLATHAGYQKLVSGKKGWELTYIRQTEDPAEILLPIAEAAADIVRRGADAHVRKCGNPECVLFFLDNAGRRRWCSMAICGNRAKVAAFARRQRRKPLNARAAGRVPGSRGTTRSRR